MSRSLKLLRPPRRTQRRSSEEARRTRVAADAVAWWLRISRGRRGDACARERADAGRADLSIEGAGVSHGDGFYRGGGARVEHPHEVSRSDGERRWHVYRRRCGCGVARHDFEPDDRAADVRSFERADVELSGDRDGAGGADRA